MSTNKKYIIALDLDGTLLKDDKTLCFLTKKYLHKLYKEGHYIVLCSGRPPRTMLKYYDQLKIDSPMISYNGALVFDPKKASFKEVGYKFNHELLRNVYLKMAPYIDSTMAENESSFFIDKEDAFLFTFFEKSDLKINKGPLNEILNEDVYTYVMKLKKETTDQNERNELGKIIESVCPEYRIRFWWDCSYAELHFDQVSKAHSLKILAEQLNLPEDQVIVFGDADNDIEMLSSFKNSFFMKNGHQNIRKYATYITKKDNNHNGIMWALKEFFKNNKE